MKPSTSSEAHSSKTNSASGFSGRLPKKKKYGSAYDQTGGGYGMDSEDSDSGESFQQSPPKCPISETYQVVHEVEKELPQWSATCTDVKIAVTRDPKKYNLETVTDGLQFLSEVIDDIQARHWDDLRRGDRVRMIIQAPSLNTPISTRFMDYGDWSPRVMMEAVAKVLNSNEEFAFDTEIQVNMVAIRMPLGGRPKKLCTDDFLRLSHSTLQIKTPGNLCLAASLLLGKYRVDENDVEYNRHSKNTSRPALRVLAESLHREAGVQIPGGDDLCGLGDVARFQQHLAEYEIFVWQLVPRKEIIYQGPATPPPHKQIHLVLHKEHYSLVTKPNAILWKSSWCPKCREGYDKASKHSCLDTCPGCLRLECPDIQNPLDQRIDCKICNRWFRGPTCFVAHSAMGPRGGKPLCQLMQKCLVCKRLKLQTDGKHLCGELYCHICKDYVAANHKCYIPIYSEKVFKHGKWSEAKPGDKLPTQPVNDYCYFDFECRQVDQDDSPCGHHVNMAVAQHSRGGEPWVFKGEDALERFCGWIFDGTHVDWTFIAHNLKGYDSYPIVNFLITNLGITPDVVVVGSKVFSINVSDFRVRFIDSLNFIPSSLAAMPSSFGLDDICKKGCFPHVFNKISNYDYAGPVPPLDDFQLQFERDLKRTDDVRRWHAEQSDAGYVFRFWEELESYCINDVEVLRQCCEAFRQTMIAETAVDPFKESITIASACNKIFRKSFLDVNSIALVPSQGYAGRDNHSFESMQWLMWRLHVDRRRIRHAMNGREIRIGPRQLKVDGYWESPDGQQQVRYMYQGCYFHGCPVCFAQGSGLHPQKNVPMADLYEQTQIDIRYLTSLPNIEVVEIWSHQWKAEMAADPEIGEYLKQYKKIPPLNPRDAFYGGRTNGSRVYYKADVANGEKIKYADVISLYPFCNKTFSYPLFHPEILLGRDIILPVEQYFGIAKCVVLPPTHLLHPILPARVNKKLYFPLCMACAGENRLTPCDHSQDERALEGTWCTVELKEAVANGYKVLRVDEVWHWERGSSELFAPFIRQFQKNKTEADGFPNGVTSEEEKDAYIADYHEKEKVLLDKAKIQKNPGRRAASKLILNSFWGKFSQRDNMPKTRFCFAHDELLELLTAQEYDIHDIIFHDQFAQVTYSLKDDFVLPGVSSSVPVGIFTTSYARIHLWKCLNFLQSRVIYYDTDSVFFISRPDEPEPPMGKYFGDFKDELGDDTWIEEMACAGPKNYGYKDNHGKSKLTIRGLTLHPHTLDQLSLDTVKQMVINKEAVPRVVLVNMGTTIKRNKNEWTMKTIPNSKKYKVVYEKRVIMPDYSTIPYGYLP